MKKIVICIDGTWNKPAQKVGGEICPTNVCLLYEHLAKVNGEGVVQESYYNEGVGTTGNWARDLMEGYSGTGTSRRIRDAYQTLMDRYEPGDEIYLFGFSRGAFTVRSLAGLIRRCGILRKDKKSLVADAYKFYRERSAECHPDEFRATEFRLQNAVEPVTRIKFVGVWGTVGALGNPLLPNFALSRYGKFHDTAISSQIDYAYHALAICERRRLFQPALWEQLLQPDGRPKNPQQVFEQRWFIGAHADVGGGYREAGLSLKALRWMMEKARDTGLAFKELSPDLYKKDCVVHDETLHKLHYKFPRPMVREIDINTKKSVRTNEVIDESVLRIMRREEKARWLNEGYRPEGLLSYLRRKGIGI